MRPVAIARAYATRLRAAQGEAREWLKALSIRQLAAYIRDVERELAETPREDFVADVEIQLARGDADLGVDLHGLDRVEQTQLVAQLAAVHMEVDQEDLAYARELLAERRRSGLDSVRRDPQPCGPIRWYAATGRTDRPGERPMRVRVGSAILASVIVFVCGSARAASLFFQAVPTPSTSICGGPCYQLRTFFQDDTRSLELTGIQMDVILEGPAVVPPTGTHDHPNGNVGNAEVITEYSNGDFAILPFDIDSNVAQVGFNDVRIANSSYERTVFSVESLQVSFDTPISCAPAVTCSIHLEGLAANRIYLGRFNFTTHLPAEVYVRVEGIDGNPRSGVEDPLEGVRRLNGSTFPIAFLTPEPSVATLVAAVLVGMTLRHRRSRAESKVE